MRAVAHLDEDEQMSGSMLITMEQAAHRLGLGRSKLYEIVLTGEVPSASIGRSRRIDIDDLRGFSVADLGKKSV